MLAAQGMCSSPPMRNSCSLKSDHETSSIATSCLFFLAARMVLLMQLLETLARYMGVNLRRRNISVT